MVTFSAVIQKFRDKGEKSGWTYIEIPRDIAVELLPGQKKSFQVKGFLDAYPFEKVNLLPMGDGNFIMALNAAMRRKIGKREGAFLNVRLAFDESPFEYPEDIMACLEDEPAALVCFRKMPESHRKWYIRWIQSAKTDATRTKRIAGLVSTCLQKGAEAAADASRRPAGADGGE